LENLNRREQLKDREVRCEYVASLRLTQDSAQWWALVNMIIKKSGSIKCGEFLDQLRDSWVPNLGSAPWS
jgi:hypothetical protein